MSTVEKFGIVAEFENPATLLKAARAINEKGYTQFDAHSPFPIHGMDDAMGLGNSPLGWIVFFGGLTGATVGMVLQWWTSAVDYPLIISNKPFFSFQAFIPVTFELMILFSAFATVFGMFFLNSLPRLYHGIFNAPGFSDVTSHRFFISVEASDDNFDETKTKSFLESIGALNVSVVEA